MIKNINDMIVIVAGDIADRKLLQYRNIDTIVNAAKPTLMGSSQGVDGAIHKAVNNFLGAGEGSFADRICNELDTGKVKNQIRCERGKAVLTSGCGWCSRIIHVVGIPFDGSMASGFKGCSSSRAGILESCYEEIVDELKTHTDIKNIAIPVIGAGEYGFPFDLAVRIAIATVGNALVEWKKKDAELFELADLERIYFYVYHQDDIEKKRYYEYSNKILKRYGRQFAKEKRVIYQNSLSAHLMYLDEVWRYDNERGYFSIARMFRLALLVLRLPFLLSMLPKDIFGRDNWERRRTVVEWFAFGKMLFPLFCLGLTYYGKTSVWFLVITAYFMCDTITYLLTLIIMADIQKPSANLIRSLILLFVNYLEVAFELAYLYYAVNYPSIDLSNAVVFGMLGDAQNSSVGTFFLYVNAGTKFFFVSLVFGYFVNHMRLRQFRS